MAGRHHGSQDREQAGLCEWKGHVLRRMTNVTATSCMSWIQRIIRRSRDPIQRGDRSSTSSLSVLQTSLLMTCTLLSPNCGASLQGVSAFFRCCRRYMNSCYGRGGHARSAMTPTRLNRFTWTCNRKRLHPTLSRTPPTPQQTPQK